MISSKEKNQLNFGAFEDFAEKGATKKLEK